MADEPRRSGRATKGVHTKNLEIPEVPSPKRAAKGGRSKSSKQTSTEPTPPGDDGQEEFIRCICGYQVEDENDDRKMIICDGCGAWQHNECMEISENDKELPKEYFCEICKPEDHQELLAKVNRGEKPWEERAKERERLDEERKARRRKGGKRGKKGRPSDVKSEASEDVNGNDTHSAEIKAGDTPGGRRGSGQKRKLESEANTEAEELEPLTKVRRVSSHSMKDVNATAAKETPQSRKSTAMAAPTARRVSMESPNGPDPVENVTDLQSDARRNSANALVKFFVEQTEHAQKQGSYKLATGQTVESVGLRLALEVEHAIFMNHPSQSAEPSAAYRIQLRSILFNVKKNTTLRDRLLRESLSPHELSLMSSDDMASKELQEKTAEMKKEAEKQHMLVQDDGPRIRRTHKGEEFVDDGSHNAGNSESIFSTAPARRRESAIEEEGPSTASAGAMSPASPSNVELPDDIGYRGTAGSPTTTKPLTVDTKAPPRPATSVDRKSSSAFNIQDVWSSVQSPDIDKQRLSRQPPIRQGSGVAHEQSQGVDVEDDADIDQLLKDEDNESEPYSPTDYKPDPEFVWRGKMAMSNVADFEGRAKHVGGANLSSTIPWSQLMPNTLSIEGRIDIDRASEYLCGLRWSHTTDVSVVAVTPVDETTARSQFDKLFNYFAERKRYGVIGKIPLTSVKDCYVVPLENGMAKKPEFIELLEHCTIEEPRPERILLLTFVIKANTTPSAHATPRHLDTAAVAGSPVAPGGAVQTPVPMGQPGSNISPIPGFGGTPQLPSYGSPGQPYSPPQPVQLASQQYYNPPLTGLSAAGQVLGPLVNAPAVSQLLAQAPDVPAQQLGVLKNIMEQVPATQNDFQMMMQIWEARHQQSGGGH
ncbi:MAG: hypothetical protein M1830_000302 [Pleopsidium flavum]|nr:MAG: hypothetical protein M1830_000302 [Pleopsidium flavum]